MNDSMGKVTIGAMGVQGFQQNSSLALKWAPVSRLALNWQLVILVCKVSP